MSSTLQQIVISPDLLGRSLVDRECRQLLELWRDGVLQPVVNRPLFVQYMRLFKTLRLSASLVRRWAWWFNSKSNFLQIEPTETLSALALCSWVAAAAPPACVVHSGHALSPPLSIPPTWKTAHRFLTDLT